MHPPTKKQQNLERAIEKLTIDGISPTYTELARELGVTHGAIRALVLGLVERGRVRRLPGRPRSLQLAQEGETAA